MNKYRIQTHHLKPHTKKNIIQFIGLGDLHIGSNTCDMEMIKSVVKRCLRRKIYVIGMGDYMEMATKTSPGNSLGTQKTPPRGQIDQVIELFKPLQERGFLLGMHSGNHEDRVMKAVNFDITSVIAEGVDAVSLPATAYHAIRVSPRLVYVVYTTHGSGGAQKTLTKLAAAQRKHESIEADIVLMGHVHESASCCFEKFVPNFQTGIVERHEKWSVLTGSYMRYHNSYADGKYAPGMLGTQLVTLNALKHQIKCERFEV